MWRGLCAILLIAVTVHAQNEAAAPHVEVTPYYKALRQGTKERIAINIVNNCLPVTMPRAAAPGIEPLQVKLDSADGLEISKPEYREFVKVKYGFSS